MALFKRKKNKLEEDTFYKNLRDTVDRVYSSSEYTDRREKMNRWLKEYNGEWWAEDVSKVKDASQSEIFANLIFAHVQTNAPLLTDNRPKWYVRAKQEFLQDYINIYARCLDYLWDKEELDHKTYLAVKDSMIFPMGLMKVYYDPDKEDYGDLCFDLVDPRTFVCAPGYDDLWKVPWCGEIVRKPMSWIKEAYPDKYEEVKSDDRDEALSNAETWDESTLEGEVVTVYEIWMRDSAIEEYLEENEDGEKEKKSRSKYPYGRFVCMTKDTVLSDRPSPFKHNKPPYVPYYDYEGVHDVWGMPEAAQVENLNREVNSRLQALVWSADKHARQNYTIDANSGLDPEQVKKELPKGDNMWVANHQMSDAPIKPIEMAPINPIHLKLIDLIMALDEEVSGITDVSKGMAVKKQRQSASEISVLIESSYTRTRQRVRNLEWSTKRLAYLAISLMQQFYDEPRDFNFREDNTLNFGTISNSPEMLKQTMPPPAQQPPSTQDRMSAERKQEDESYQKMLEYIEKNPDRIYADFEIEIQTNSTLPMDRQSLANLALRLFEMKAIDRLALFEFLSLPMGKEIAQRMAQQEMQMAQMKAGPEQAPQGATLPIRPAQAGPQLARQGVQNAANAR